jgi:hypothetical protein
MDPGPLIELKNLIFVEILTTVPGPILKIDGQFRFPSLRAVLGERFKLNDAWLLELYCNGLSYKL